MELSIIAGRQSEREREKYVNTTDSFPCQTQECMLRRCKSA